MDKTVTEWQILFSMTSGIADFYTEDEDEYNEKFQDLIDNGDLQYVEQCIRKDYVWNEELEDWDEDYVEVLYDAENYDDYKDTQRDSVTNEYKYKVSSYYDVKYLGLEDTFYTNDWSEVEDEAHKKLMQGNCVLIQNLITGKEIKLNPDEYDETFDGEFLVKPDQLEESKQDSKLVKTFNKTDYGWGNNETTYYGELNDGNYCVCLGEPAYMTIYDEPIIKQYLDYLYREDDEDTELEAYYNNFNKEHDVTNKYSYADMEQIEQEINVDYLGYEDLDENKSTDDIEDEKQQCEAEIESSSKEKKTESKEVTRQLQQNYKKTLERELEKVQNAIANAGPGDISGLEDRRDFLVDKIDQLESDLNKKEESKSTDSVKDMFNNLPDNIKSYLENTDNVPTKEIEGTLWFDITQEEKEQLEQFVNYIDTIPEDVWRKWDEKTKWDISSYVNNADRICRNCTLKLESKDIKTENKNNKIEVENYHLEDMGGHTMAVFGSLKDGRYFAGNEEIMTIYDDDIWPQYCEDDPDTTMWEKEHTLLSTSRYDTNKENLQLYYDIISQTSFFDDEDLEWFKEHLGLDNNDVADKKEESLTQAQKRDAQHIKEYAKMKGKSVTDPDIEQAMREWLGLTPNEYKKLVKSLKTESKKVEEQTHKGLQEEIEINIDDAIYDYLIKDGYETEEIAKEFIKDYVVVKTWYEDMTSASSAEILEKYLAVEVRAELDYDDLSTLSTYLDKVVQKYDASSYFDFITGGTIRAYIQIDTTKKTEANDLDKKTEAVENLKIGDVVLATPFDGDLYSSIYTDSEGKYTGRAAGVIYNLYNGKCDIVDVGIVDLYLDENNNYTGKYKFDKNFEHNYYTTLKGVSIKSRKVELVTNNDLKDDILYRYDIVMNSKSAPKEVLKFQQTTDSRYDKDAYMLLQRRLKELENKLNIKGVKFNYSEPSWVPCDGYDQWVSNCTVKKTAKNVTWEDIYEIINSIKAVPYKLVVESKKTEGKEVNRANALLDLINEVYDGMGDMSELAEWAEILADDYNIDIDDESMETDEIMLTAFNKMNDNDFRNEVDNFIESLSENDGIEYLKDTLHTYPRNLKHIVQCLNTIKPYASKPDKIDTAIEELKSVNMNLRTTAEEFQEYLHDNFKPWTVLGTTTGPRTYVNLFEVPTDYDIVGADYFNYADRPSDMLDHIGYGWKQDGNNIVADLIGFKDSVKVGDNYAVAVYDQAPVKYGYSATIDSSNKEAKFKEMANALMSKAKEIKEKYKLGENKITETKYGDSNPDKIVPDAYCEIKKTDNGYYINCGIGTHTDLGAGNFNIYPEDYLSNLHKEVKKLAKERGIKRVYDKVKTLIPEYNAMIPEYNANIENVIKNLTPFAEKSKQGQLTRADLDDIEEIIGKITPNKMSTLPEFEWDGKFGKLKSLIGNLKRYETDLSNPLTRADTITITESKEVKTETKITESLDIYGMSEDDLIDMENKLNRYVKRNHINYPVERVKIRTNRGAEDYVGVIVDVTSTKYVISPKVMYAGVYLSNSPMRNCNWVITHLDSGVCASPKEYSSLEDAINDVKRVDDFLQNGKFKDELATRTKEMQDILGNKKTEAVNKEEKFKEMANALMSKAKEIKEKYKLGESKKTEAEVKSKITKYTNDMWRNNKSNMLINPEEESIGRLWKVKLPLFTTDYISKSPTYYVYAESKSNALGKVVGFIQNHSKGPFDLLKDFDSMERYIHRKYSDEYEEYAGLNTTKKEIDKKEYIPTELEFALEKGFIPVVDEPSAEYDCYVNGNGIVIEEVSTDILQEAKETIDTEKEKEKIEKDMQEQGKQDLIDTEQELIDGIKKEIYQYTKQQGLDIEKLRKQGIELDSIADTIDKVVGDMVSKAAIEFMDQTGQEIDWDFEIKNNDIHILWNNKK